MPNSNDVRLPSDRPFETPSAGGWPRRAALSGFLSLAGGALCGCTQQRPRCPQLAPDDPGKYDYLRFMGEPPLRDYQDPSAEVYRVLWVRSFHRPIAVRAEAIGSRRTLYVKRLGGSNHEEGCWVVDFSTRRAILGFEWRRLRALIDDALYANLDGPSVLMADGAEWIFEAMRGGHYTADSRQSPCDVPDNRRFCEAGRYFVNLGGPHLYHSRGFY